jgi:hypothetical protein
MEIIAHRANLNGPNKKTENTVESIYACIKLGFGVEIDVWFLNNDLFLGHDYPVTKISHAYLNQLPNEKLWIHCKNLDALYGLREKYNCFIHDKDDATITSKGYVWVYPGRLLGKNSIAVMPETQKYSIDAINACFGICTDYPLKYKNDKTSNI